VKIIVGQVQYQRNVFKLLICNQGQSPCVKYSVNNGQGACVGLQKNLRLILSVNTLHSKCASNRPRGFVSNLITYFEIH